MAKTFFENFRDAERIMSPLYNNPYGDANLPSTQAGINSAAWRERVAMPFSYKTKTNNGAEAYNTGILYLPAYEASKIQKNGALANGATDAEIYGAEINGQSLNKNGFQRLFNDEANSDFKFDATSAQQAFKDTYGRNSTSVDASGFKAEKGDFIKNLRNVLWGL